MTRRQFVASCVALMVAWLTAPRKLELREWFRGALEDGTQWPLGLLDSVRSVSIHGLSRSSYYLWSPA